MKVTMRDSRSDDVYLPLVRKYEEYLRVIREKAAPLLEVRPSCHALSTTWLAHSTARAAPPNTRLHVPHVRTHSTRTLPRCITTHHPPPTTHHPPPTTHHAQPALAWQLGKGTSPPSIQMMYFLAAPVGGSGMLLCSTALGPNHIQSRLLTQVKVSMSPAWVGLRPSPTHGFLVSAIQQC